MALLNSQMWIHAPFVSREKLNANALRATRRGDLRVCPRPAPAFMLGRLCPLSTP
jgi:hypothetical protein